MVSELKVSTLKQMVARKTGIPVGVFRLVSPHGKEMYDVQNVGNYNIQYGMTVK